VERVGIENRNDLGLLVWEHDEASTAAYNLGSRLKTPDLPIWVTKINGHVGILFNPNKELTRSYHVENRYVHTSRTSHHNPQTLSSWQ
jgi:hypothetical protein